jgi:molecular chaperone GrpE
MCDVLDDKEAENVETVEFDAENSKKVSGKESEEKSVKKVSKKEKNSFQKKLEKAQEELQEATEKATEYSDKILRLNAEFDNYRKRVIRERDEIRINTRVDAVETIAPVLDHFELALNAAGDTQNVDALLEGMKMIQTEFEKALIALGVEVINAEGVEFDPNLHEAIANEVSEEVEKNIVIKQWRPGYKINNRLIRPATVVVSSGKSEE